MLSNKDLPHNVTTERIEITFVGKENANVHL